MAHPPASLLLLMYLLQNSVLLRAKKMVKLMKYPVFIPNVWQVDAYSMWCGGSSVNAQPSTAMSCRCTAHSTRGSRDDRERSET